MPENKTKLGQEPAFATSALLSASEDIFQEGMSKRFFSACQIAPSVISATLTNDKVKKGIAKVMKDSKNYSVEQVTVSLIYEYVDELLRQE